jgi:hypothetical protein
MQKTVPALLFAEQVGVLKIEVMVGSALIITKPVVDIMGAQQVNKACFHPLPVPGTIKWFFGWQVCITNKGAIRQE